MARTKALPVPEVGAEAPEFYLPSAQGGQLRLSMRTARGPVVVVFYSGGWSAEDVAYFKDLPAKEDEINLAEATIVGVGIGEFASARDFAREIGIKSYVLYDYTGVATRAYGLLERDEEHGEYARPATLIVGPDHKVIQAWIGERPKAEEILAKVSELTGFPKAAEEAEGEDKPERTKERKRLSPEEREKRRAERHAGREDEAKGKSDGESGNGSDGG